MEKQKYRIAVMGAYGVGKTTFLGSYFNLVINKGEGVPVSLNTPEMVDQVARITGTLFKKQVPVTEKAMIENMAYSIETLGMDVEFVDVASSENFKTLPDLKSVNGILFFLSAEDLVKNPVKVKKDNEVFQEAIDYILQNSDSKWYDFQKFPLYCILTKCDAVPQVTEDELAVKTADFLNAAKGASDLASEEDVKPFLFEAGKNLRCFSTVSLGKWTDTKALPKKYEPENVLEPMEDLYAAMARVPRARKRVKRAAWAVGGLLILAVGSSWGLDIYQWEKTKEEARKLASEARYEDAINHVNQVADRNDKNELISEIYRQYEKAKFDGILPVIKDLDVNVPPEAPLEEFLEASKKVDEYLKNSSFKQASAANYEKVNSLAWYFEAGKKLLSTTPEETGHAADALNKWLETLPQLP
jgi:GTPase SAR1 family protein